MEDVKWNKLASNILHLTFRRICSAGFVPRETIRLYNMQNQPITKKNKN